LADQDVAEFVVEGGAIFRRFEIALGQAPVADGLRYSSHQGADSGLALGRADGAVEIFARHDVSRGHRPVLGDFDVLLLEDGVALGVGDLSGTALPFDLVVGRDAGFGEEAAEGQARGFPGGGGRDALGRGVGSFSQ